MHFSGLCELANLLQNHELVCKKTFSFFSDVHFCDLGTKRASVVFSFRHSKTNKTGLPQIIRLVQAVNQSLCPALAAFAEVRPRLPGSFFCHFVGSPLTQYQFNAVLKKVLSFCGFGWCPTEGPFLSYGAATTASALGISLGEIRSMGRWRSDAVQLYIRPVVQCQLPDI